MRQIVIKTGGIFPTPAVFGGIIMKKTKSALSLLLAALMLFSTFIIGVSAEDTPKYIINNPYKDVDFDNWQGYKVQLHCQTNASDGYQTIHEMVQECYDLGYNAVALTDHGTINRGWTEQPQLVPIIRYVKKERTKMADIIPLTDEEYEAYANGTAKTTNGEERTGGLIDIPMGIELNAATPVCDCHLTGYYCDYGQGFIGVYGDYETPSAGVKAAGGISMLSHVGEYVYPDKDSADHVGQPVDEYFVNKFARIFIDNKGSSVGMGINSATDAHTRCDRILYDQILKKTIPNGVVPWAFTFSDAHNEEAVNDAYTIHYMPELTTEAVRESMENGTLFAVSHYSNGVELNGMQEIPGYKDEDCDTVNWRGNDTPLVTRVAVDDEKGTISVEGTNFNRITWIVDGNVAVRGGKDEAVSLEEATTFNLYDYDGDIEYFVRFYITGDNGICYSQPFVIDKEGVVREAVEVPETNDTSTKLRKLVTVIDKLFFKNNIFIKLFKYFVLGYWDSFC